jgi:hypothetical protein
VSTSTRVGYRWLNSDRSWMFGLNGGYDSRSLKSGNTDTGVSVTNKKTVGFQQIALNAEAVSNSWTLNGYGLIPVGDVEQRLNSVYDSGALNTYGLDAEYFITPVLKASAGYYYQHRNEEYVNGSGVRGRLAYEISNGLTAGVNVSYDEAFDTRVSADINYKFGFSEINLPTNPPISSLSSSPSNREIRVHDASYKVSKCWKYQSDETTLDTSYKTETCSDYSTGYESAASAGTTKTLAYESCTKRAGAFSYKQNVKTSGKVKYTYYCSTNS